MSQKSQMNDHLNVVAKADNILQCSSESLDPRISSSPTVSDAQNGLPPGKDVPVIKPQMMVTSPSTSTDSNAQRSRGDSIYGEGRGQEGVQQMTGNETVSSIPKGH